MVIMLYVIWNLISAQLPFQSSVQSPSVVKNKKRKLTSPSVECRSPKTIKVLEKNLTKENVDNTKSAANIDTKDDDNCIDIIKDTEIENVKENTTSNKVDARDKFETPKRTSTVQKKLEKQEKLKSSSLTKFLQKTDKQEDKLKEESQVSVQKEDDSTKNTPKKGIDSGTSVSQTNTVNNKIEDSPSILNDSLSQSDSDIAIISSDNEEKDEQTKSATSTTENASDTLQILKTPTTEKSKQKKLTPKQQEKQLLSAKKKEERKKLKMVSCNVYDVNILFYLIIKCFTYSLGERKKIARGTANSAKRKGRETQRKGGKGKSRERTETDGKKIEGTKEAIGNRV